MSLSPFGLKATSDVHWCGVRCERLRSVRGLMASMWTYISLAKLARVRPFFAVPCAVPLLLICGPDGSIRRRAYGCPLRVMLTRLSRKQSSFTDSSTFHAAVRRLGGGRSGEIPTVVLCGGHLFSGTSDLASNLFLLNWLLITCALAVPAI